MFSLKAETFRLRAFGIWIQSHVLAFAQGVSGRSELCRCEQRLWFRHAAPSRRSFSQPKFLSSDGSLSNPITAKEEQVRLTPHPTQ